MALILASNGCSGFFVRPARRQDTGEMPRCTTSPAAPIADTVVAGGAAAFGALALDATINCSRRGNCAESAGPAVLVLSGLVFAATAASAVYGFHQTNRCQTALMNWCESHDCGAFGAAPMP